MTYTNYHHLAKPALRGFCFFISYVNTLFIYFDYLIINHYIISHPQV